MGILNIQLFIVITLTAQAEVREYCYEEYFAERCDGPQVLVMDSARYGRMRPGRCLNSEFGNLGCYADVIGFFDKQCSGKTECDVKVSNEIITVDVSCNVQLMRYLEASYTCTSVRALAPRECQVQLGSREARAGEPRAGEQQGALMPASVLQASCGSHFSPLVLQAQPGQRIALSMLDFYAANASSLDCTSVYGQLLDLENNESLRICGGQQRHRQLILSSAHRLQIKVEPDASAKFMLNFKVENCPTTLNMVNGWFQSEGNVGQAGCHDNDHVWHLTCQDNVWTGLTGDCIVRKGHLATIAGINISHDTLIMAASVLVLVVSAVIVLVGCIYMRVYCKKKPPPPPPEVYYSRDFQFMRPCDNCDTMSRRDPRAKPETQQETSFSQVPSDTRYRSLHPNGMQGRPLPEIPEYDVPANVHRAMDEQETLLVRGQANDPSTSSALEPPARAPTEEETRRMQSIIRGHPNNMTLFSGAPHSRMPKNPRLYASTMGRVLRDHPGMIQVRDQPNILQTQALVNPQRPPVAQKPVLATKPDIMSKSDFQQAPKITQPPPDITHVPDVARVERLPERIHTEDSDSDTPVPCVLGGAVGQPSQPASVGPGAVPPQTVLPHDTGVAPNSLLRTLASPRHGESRPLSV